MYFDLSSKKIVFLALVVMVLLSLVYLTNGLKKDAFGTTPYFYAVNVGSKYVFDSFLAMFERRRDAPQNEASASAIPVLTYHRVVSGGGDVTTINIAQFKDQMTALKNAGWQTITLQQFEDFMNGKRSLPQKSFLLTFDDGAKDSFYPVDPVLNKLGYNAVMYVIAHAAETPESTYYLSPQEIQLMLKTGRWEIGSHSYDGHHPYPVDADGDPGVFFADLLWNKAEDRLETPAEFKTRVTDDLSKARSDLESTYGVPVNTFAFPLGTETGIQGADNYPDGASVSETAARQLYDFGFLQTDRREYTFNFPRSYVATASSTPGLADGFIVRRVHVDYDWSGQRLLSVLENGLDKQLPYNDDFTADLGWIIPWGTLELGRNNFVLSATPDLTSASSFLDGSALWKDYSFDASIVWHKDDVFLLADVVNSRTYDACVFSEGSVHIQQTISGTTQELKIVKDPNIAYSDTAQMGIRVHGSTIECTWGFASIAEVYSRSFSGGIGVQVWNSAPGTASVQVTSILARPFSESAPAATSSPQE